ncbi:VirB8/TrbF family protein [Bartonella sp. DGB2]|uniref:VirB8/TrbF family protein n=1 Tax=Bartonella sp. DGB2 TaxID=3388426 RepID=UPI0039902939
MNFFKKKKKNIENLLPISPDVQEETENNNTKNPYLSPRRVWNEHVGSLVSANQTWQFIGILSMLIALTSVAGIIYIGKQSKFVPYIVEVDKIGQAVGMGTVRPTTTVDTRIARAIVADFITNARLVTPDIALQRNAILKLYAFLNPNDPAALKMNEWLNGNADANPFKRAENEMVSIEITSILQQSPQTWQVDWKENTRNRQGGFVKPPENMRALVNVYTVETNSETKEEQLLANPLGVYIKDFSWSRIQ